VVEIAHPAIAHLHAHAVPAPLNKTFNLFVANTDGHNLAANVLFLTNQAVTLMH